MAPVLGHLSSLKNLRIPEQETITMELLDQVAQLSALQDLNFNCRYVSAT